MDNVLVSSAGVFAYPQPTLRRGDLALRCSPFSLELWQSMNLESIPLPVIAGNSGLERKFTRKPLSERRVESELMWLIQVGLLRREVDGQGITDSFRLTPLGKQIIQTWEKLGAIPPANWWERCQNQIKRWLSFSF